MKVFGISLFIGIPLVLILALTSPITLSEEVAALELSVPTVKHQAFLKRPLVDTLICGDSRVGRIMPGAFLARDWFPFNWALSGLNPLETAMQVQHALLYGDIRRAVIGVSFEALASEQVIGRSLHQDKIPFSDPQFKNLWGLYDKAGQSNPLFVKTRLDVLKLYLDRFKYGSRSYWGAKDRFRMLLKEELHPIINAYGNFNYSKIHLEIKDGTFNFREHRNPSIFFNRSDSEVAYLKNKILSKEAMQVYSRIFQELRSRKIPTVVFETGRLESYQLLIDRDPLLRKLNHQWREFFRKEAYGNIKFIAVDELKSSYYAEDFFDPVHFIGEKTENALSEKLASELAMLELQLNAQN